MNTALALALIELILRYGPSTAISIIRGFNKDNITEDDIRELIISKPEDYFNGK